MKQLSDNTTASLVLHLIIISDISIIISFSQTQGPNTGSVSVTKKNIFLKNESFYVHKVIITQFVLVYVIPHLFTFSSTILLLIFTLHNKPIPSILKYATQIWHIHFLSNGDLWVRCYSLLLLCKWKRAVLRNAQVFHSQILLESSLLREEQTISISAVGFADAHLCCYLCQTFHTYTHTHTHRQTSEKMTSL